MPPLPEPAFEVVFSGAQRARVRTLGAVAARRGLLREYLAALSMVLDRLAAAPQEWGDPYARLDDLGLRLYHRSCAPLNIFYAVDPLRRIVYLKDIDPLPGCGLDVAE